MANGWTYVGGEPVWRPNVETARAEIHSELDRFHGEEYDRLKELLDDLVAAVRREAAEDLTASIRRVGDTPGELSVTFVCDRIADMVAAKLDSEVTA